MKKIYCINLDYDLGELWLDENKKPIKLVYSNDADFRSEYHGFIIEYFGGKLISINYCPTDSEWDKLECVDDYEDMWKVLKKSILKELA